jgi:hypothetical protein
MILPAKEVWIHHSVTSVNMADPDRDARGIEKIGISRFGIPSYSFLIHPAGRIYQLMDDRQGAHTVADKPGWYPTNRNPFSYGICFIGNYETTEPTDWMLRAAAQVIWHKIHTEKNLVAGASPRGGHRDLKSTACPGTRLYNKIPLIRSYAANAGKVEIDMTDVQAKQLADIHYWLTNPRGQSRAVTEVDAWRLYEGVVQMKDPINPRHPFKPVEYREPNLLKQRIDALDAKLDKLIAALEPTDG